VVKNWTKRASSHEDRFPKILFALSWCRITDDVGSKDLLSRSQMHIDKRDEVASTAQQQKRRSIDALVFFMAVRVTTILAAARIYREDPSRATASHNRLGLSLSKRIRQGLIAKLNGKSRSRTFGSDFDKLFTHTSCARAHRLASPQGERARVSSFLPSSTHLQVHRKQPTL
jgi:hypothetical protein